MTRGSVSGDSSVQMRHDNTGDAPPESPAQLKAVIAGLQRELILAQRLAYAGTVSSMLAHEYNNLMTPILARSMNALSRGDAETMRSTLDRTVTQVQKAVELSRHLLKLTDSTRDVDQPDDVCVVATAVQEAVAEAVRPFAKDGLELRISVPEDLQVRARSLLLEQVLLNLLVNAREAMDGRAGSISVSARGTHGFVEIDVSDSGRGLPDSADAFNDFLDTNAERDTRRWQQVGLGLHVCRLLAQQHGASIRVSNNDGVGCTFTLRWPTPDN